jgi:hypothetical protein
MYEYFSYSQKRNQLMEMAHDSIVWNVNIGLCHCILNLSNFSLMEWIQHLFILFAALASVAFLIYKWMPKSKSKKGGSCDTNCGCH